jgi:glyoxylase-like metal-dependent hydrolase (beta-lactamase superfamily II)
MAALGRVVDLCPPLYRVEPLEPGVPVGDLVPIATPGHTPGHVCLLHRRDRALLSGDAVLWDGERCHLPEPSLSVDPDAARAAVAALLEHDFDALLPGHGPPLLGGAHRAIERMLDGKG